MLANRRRQPACWDDVVKELAKAVTADLITNLTAQDKAPEDLGPGSMIHFLLTYDTADPLRTAIAQGLSANEFTVADVAARCVTVATVDDSTTELVGFEQETFDRIVPAKPDPWYELPRPQTTVNERDLSWSNRKTYITGGVRQPWAER